ncbi:MAG TPA: hypothetical protein VGT42_04620 [Gammaproteobacteria bacterium]|nr:hypothetical protein [Gammaproteobacteria bacterium]
MKAPKPLPPERSKRIVVCLCGARVPLFARLEFPGTSPCAECGGVARTWARVPRWRLTCWLIYRWRLFRWRRAR